MKNWSRTLIAGSALVLLTNAVVLAGAAYNRNGEPESQLRLTQRELQHASWRKGKDNSGITLTLDWRVPSELPKQNNFGLGYVSGRWASPAWLDKVKMSELGFDVIKLASTSVNHKHKKELQSKEVLLVLELNGQIYQRGLKYANEYAEQSRELQASNPSNEEFKQRAKRAEEEYKREEQTNSRLFVIDAGVDLHKLRTMYPDRARYAIVHGLIQPGAVQEKNEIHITGHISEVHAEHVNVPLDYRSVFETAAPYEAVVMFGKRLEPWIANASKSPVLK